MKVLGIIVEYNPFHNGHLYHLEQARLLSGADYVVCVMSGNFIQRGEPAIVSKWARTHMALLHGIDLVLELPVVYAMSTAEFFAYGAVKILNSLGIVDYICFGSETGDINELDSIADILVHEPSLYKDTLKEYLDKGLSYPSAREAALVCYLNKTSGFSGHIEKVIGSSNSILGIEYIKALKRLNSRIIPMTITRINNSYNTEELTGSISSATSIRKLIFKKGNITPELKKVLPQKSLDILLKEFSLGRGPIFSHSFEDMILAFLRKLPPEHLRDLPYVSEGLENRIKEAAKTSGTLDELIGKISTKRYPRTRIQRIIFNILTDVTASELETFNKYGGPQYIRVLGFNNNGRYLLSRIKHSTELPIVVKTANFKNSCNPLLRRMLEIESQVTDIYVLAYSNLEFRKAGQEYTQNIIRIGT